LLSSLLLCRLSGDAHPPPRGISPMKLVIIFERNSTVGRLSNTRIACCYFWLADGRGYARAPIDVLNPLVDTVKTAIKSITLFIIFILCLSLELCTRANIASLVRS
jgi:hypothetical protein